MGIRREEERNEKIIRGLMKLPPNRRCINCNSLGPQYVCTSFWTFICITCSGIHREFTHRVKSVSMSKFTSQEVEALQNGGNQRARELFLKDWGLQGLRLPDISNVDKVRLFIKNVYVDRKFVGVKISDKPPRDLQNIRNHEDHIRRASSYHSYSQSPPYDHQYEDRKYGKQASILSRRPGSDRGIYEGKISNFIYSPGRLSDQGFEDKFANEGSVSRTSNYSTSNGGDQCRSGSQSPISQEIGITSPCTSNNSMRNTDGVPLPQRAVPLGRSGSIDSNFVLLNSGHLKNIESNPKQSTKNSRSLDLFEPPFSPSSSTSLPSTIDLFQPPTSSYQSFNLFQSSQKISVPSMHISNSQFIPEISVPKNDGWATFETNPTSYKDSRGNLQSSLSSNTSMQNSYCQSSAANMASFASLNPWNDDLHGVQDSIGIKSWNAFEDNISHSSVGSTQQTVDPWPTYKPSFIFEPLDLKHVEESNKVVSQGDAIDVASNAVSEITVPSYTRSDLSSTGGTESHLCERKSTNPFELPYDSVEPSDLFLQPDEPPWFTQNQITTPQVGLGYIMGTTSASQLPVVAECPVASNGGGGNPFA